MGFGSFLKGVAAQVNPFDNGKTYGSYNAPKKKRPEDDPRIVNPMPSSGLRPNQQMAPDQAVKVSAQRPENLFAGLNNNLKLPTSPSTSIPVVKNNSSIPSALPLPGTVITPNQPKDGYQAPAGVSGTRSTKNGMTGVMATNKVTGKQNFVPDAPKPKSNSAGAKIGRFFGGAKDLAVGTVSNIPEVGLAAGRAATGIVQGVTQIPHIATAGLATVTDKTAQKFSNPVTRQINRGFQDVNTGTKNVTNVINKPIDFVNRGIDSAARGYESAVPTAYAGANVYKNTQIPINVLAALLTAGGSTAAEGGSVAGKIGQSENVLSKFSRFINKPLTSNTDNVVSKTAQAVSNKTTPVVQALNSPISTTKTAITNKVNNFRTLPTAEKDIIDAGEAGNVVSKTPTQIEVTQPQPIEVNAPVSEPVNVPVTNNTPIGAPIRELGGDTPGQVRIPTADEAAAQRAASRFENQPTGRPDQNIEGVSKPNTGNTGVFTKAEIQAERQALDDALANKEINKTAHKAANKELDGLTAADAPAKGQKIQVKSVDSIPVQGVTDVPAGLPENPGTVRATVNTAPNNAASEVVANTPAAIPIPKVGTTLPDGTTVTKRMVASARNQAKLAKAKAKADEAVAAATDRSAAVKPTAEGKGFVDTGEYATGKNGNVIQRVHNTTEQSQAWHEIQNKSTGEILSQSEQEMLQNGSRSEQTVRNLKAKLQDPSVPRNTPEGKALLQEYKDSLTRYAQGLALADKTVRANGTGDQIANKVINKLIVFAEDGTKLTDSHIKQITDAENSFTAARDAADSAAERFKASGSEADFAAWKAARGAADKADREAKVTEYLVAKDVLKGNKSIESAKAIQDAEKNAGVYSMDAIDANMLSGTGTMVRNYINTLFPRLENKVFGRVTSRLVKPIATVGGSSGRGARMGAKIGGEMYKADIGARKEAGVGFIRRTVTAGNTVGERNIQATAYSKGFDHYKQILSKKGYTGKELNNRAEFMARSDPQKLVAQYEQDALQANALSSLTHSKKIENVLADGIQKALANAGVGGKGQQAGRFGAKAVTRVSLGFPTVIAKSLAEGLKRATVGIPEALWSTGKFINTGNKDAYAAELAKAMQHAGSGGGMILLGHQLGKMGVVSGAYPSDPAERQKWEAEGRQENSINIGGQWFNIPGYLGGFALPLMLGASSASGNIKDEASLKNAWSTVLAASPVDSLQSTLDIMTGNSSDAKIKNAVTSLARSATPAGAFVAELAKLTDSTKNDTSTKDALHNILDNIAGGIPGLNNKVNTIDKTDAYGNVLHNPNRVATVFGAQGSEQNQGKASVQEGQNAANDSVSQLSEAGVLENKSLMSLVDAKLAKKISDNQPLTPEEVAKVQKSVTKGVSATDDNNWRENGDYGTDKAALTAKLQMLETDPTAKKSEKESIKTQIARDEVLAKENIPYDALKLYQTTSLTDWRDMGDPESDNYNADMYQKLYEIDSALTGAKGSYNTGDPTTNKYTAKAPSKGRGGKGSGSGSYSSDFGKLKAGTGAPEVKQYQSLDQASGNVPMIQVVRPNIVHKISSSG